MKRLYLAALVMVAVATSQQVAMAAISFDATSAWTTGSSVTSTSFNITVGTSSNEMLFVLALTTNSSTATAKFNGVSMTQILARSGTGNDTRTITLFALPSAVSGTHSVVISVPATQAVVQGGASSYFGMNQSTTPDATSTAEATATVSTYTASLTTVSNNDWTILGVREEMGGGNFLAGASTTFRSNSATTALSDTNAPKTPAGVQSMTVTDSGGVVGLYDVMAAFSPAGTSTSTIATSDALLFAGD